VERRGALWKTKAFSYSPEVAQVDNGIKIDNIIKPPEAQYYTSNGVT
jgi:hypothetical protein